MSGNILFRSLRDVADFAEQHCRFGARADDGATLAHRAVWIDAVRYCHSLRDLANELRYQIRVAREVASCCSAIARDEIPVYQFYLEHLSEVQ